MTARGEQFPSGMGTAHRYLQPGAWNGGYTMGFLNMMTTLV